MNNKMLILRSSYLLIAHLQSLSHHLYNIHQLNHPLHLRVTTEKYHLVPQDEYFIEMGRRLVLEAKNRPQIADFGC